MRRRLLRIKAGAVEHLAKDGKIVLLNPDDIFGLSYRIMLAEGSDQKWAQFSLLMGPT